MTNPTETTIDGLLDGTGGKESFHHPLAGGGELRIDRGLPFLLVYREPPGRQDAGTARLIAAEAAYLIAGPDSADEAESLVRTLAKSGSEKFGAFLVLEIWTATDPESRRFTLHAPTGPAPETVEKALEALEPLRDLRPGVEVALVSADDRHPPGMSPLLTIEESWQSEVLLLGLEIPPIFRDPGTGQIYPRFLRVLQHGLSRALRQAIYQFTRVQTKWKVENALALGTRSAPAPVWEIDRALWEIEHAFDLLLLVSPVNNEEAWQRFEASGFEENPTFHYRLLPMDPDLLKRRLFSLEFERVDDPALANLLDDKRQELDTLLTMLRERGTAGFRLGSQRLYGEVDDELKATAEELLRTVQKPRRWMGDWVDAEGFRVVAAAELDRYREQFSRIDRTIEIRRDVTGLMVSEGNLMIGETLQIRPDRVMPLIHHEVGTHVLTYLNGSTQPLGQLSTGLAGYDELQEGLAVLAEYFAGGLDRLRMRLLAARVLAAGSVEDGADFLETFRLLRRDLDYSPSGAWHIALRVHASGGFTRDLIYLRGLIELLALLREGADLESLYIGKIAQKHIPIVEELRHRQLLREPPLTPRYLTEPEAADRLDAVRRGIPLTELICPDPR